MRDGTSVHIISLTLLKTLDMLRKPYRLVIIGIITVVT